VDMAALLLLKGANASMESPVRAWSQLVASL